MVMITLIFQVKNVFQIVTKNKLKLLVLKPVFKLFKKNILLKLIILMNMLIIVEIIMELNIFKNMMKIFVLKKKIVQVFIIIQPIKIIVKQIVQIQINIIYLMKENAWKNAQKLIHILRMKI